MVLMCMGAAVADAQSCAQQREMCVAKGRSFVWESNSQCRCEEVGASSLGIPAQGAAGGSAAKAAAPAPKIAVPAPPVVQAPKMMAPASAGARQIVPAPATPKMTQAPAAAPATVKVASPPAADRCVPMKSCTNRGGTTMHVKGAGCVCTSALK